MSVPLATGTVTLLSPATGEASQSAENWRDDANYVPVATGIPARLSGPSSSRGYSPEGSATPYTYRLIADPCPLTDDMRVIDDRTGDVYQVNTAWQVVDFIPQTLADMVRVSSGT